MKKIKFFSYFYHTVLFHCSKNIRLNSTHSFVMKIPNKRYFQQIAFNHLSDINFQNFKNIYKKCTA